MAAALYKWSECKESETDAGEEESEENTAPESYLFQSAHSDYNVATHDNPLT